jgi:hypothetical protein
MAMTQAEAVATLEDGQRQLDTLLAALDDDQLARPATIGGGDWSAQDLLAHIAFWEEIALRAVAEWRAGQPPWIENVFREKRVDEVNAENQQRSREMSLAAVRRRASTAHQELIRLVAGMTAAEWTARAPFQTDRRENLGMMLASITGAPRRGFGHVFAHLPDLEAYVATVAPPA